MNIVPIALLNPSIGIQGVLGGVPLRCLFKRTCYEEDRCMTTSSCCSVHAKATAPLGNQGLQRTEHSGTLGMAQFCPTQDSSNGLFLL